jgi:hypothetical protein
MPLPTQTILGLLADNLAHRRSVLPLSNGSATRWAKGLEIPYGGETILYTGHMYQLIPSIAALAGVLARLESSPLTSLFGVGRAANRLVDLTALTRPLLSRSLRREADRMLRNIASLLRQAGVSFGYLYGDELYSGALVYDEGLDDVVASHAARVVETFRSHGVQKIITVDPHTTHMLRSVYPRLVPGFDLEVKSYLEVLAGMAARRGDSAGGSLVIHDSCVYARYEGVVRPPRELLRDAGVEVLEPRFSGVSTFCCGGPIEVLFPTEAGRVARQRMAQLTDMGERVTTMCPICLVNLRKAAPDPAEVVDISQVLLEAAEREHTRRAQAVGA